MQVRELVSPGYFRENLFEFCPSSAEETDGGQFESVHRRSDGSSFPVDVRLSRLFYKDGHALLAVIRDITERKLAEERIRMLPMEIIAAQEKERKFVAHDIHDSLGSSLSAIKYSLEKSLDDLKKGLALQTDSLEKVVSTVQTAIEESRRISTNLRPSILDDLGILPTISWFCRQFKEVYSSIAIVRETDIQEADVPEVVKLVVFRILQEAFANTAKHSFADTIWVSLRKIDDIIELSIEDNGRGFDPERPIQHGTIPSGIGLINMRERVELSGGTFQIQSATGRGTTIRIMWPST
jgi:signal transduction histidine kinase